MIQQLVSNSDHKSSSTKLKQQKSKSGILQDKSHLDPQLDLIIRVLLVCYWCLISLIATHSIIYQSGIMRFQIVHMNMLIQSLLVIKLIQSLIARYHMTREGTLLRLINCITQKHLLRLDRMLMQFFKKQPSEFIIQLKIDNQILAMRIMESNQVHTIREKMNLILFQLVVWEKRERRRIIKIVVDVQYFFNIIIYESRNRQVTQKPTTPPLESKVQPPQKKNEPESLEDIFKRISCDFEDVTPLIKLAERFNVLPGQLILGIIILAFAMTVMGAGNLIVKLLIGMLYPGYMTVQCIKNADNQKSKMWIAYWIIFLITFLLDRFIWFFFHDLQSLYYPLKQMILIWMYYPKTRGAIIIFDILVDKLVFYGVVQKKKQN